MKGEEKISESSIHEQTLHETERMKQSTPYFLLGPRSFLQGRLSKVKVGRPSQHEFQDVMNLIMHIPAFPIIFVLCVRSSHTCLHKMAVPTVRRNSCIILSLWTRRQEPYNSLLGYVYSNTMHGFTLHIGAEQNDYYCQWNVIFFNLAICGSL